MEFSVGIDKTTGKITAKGRFDFGSHRGFRESYDPLLQNSALKEIELNMAGVEYMDSSALGMLLMLRDRAKAVNKEVVLSKPNDTVMQILEIANFPKLFRIVA